MDLKLEYQKSGRGRNTDLTIGTGDTGTKTLITSRGAAFTIFVQSIVVTISTSAAQSLTFQDSNSSAKYVYKVTSGPGADTRWEWDGTERGEPLTAGKDFDVVISGAGLGAQIEVIAYETPIDSPVTVSYLDSFHP